MITILTATCNAEQHLPALIDSLCSQSDKGFTWLVIDNQSTDRTLELLNQVRDIDLTVVCEKDFGIYDAFNKGLSRITTEYYLVVGADDILYPNAIAAYKHAALHSHADLITAHVHSQPWNLVPSRTFRPYAGIWSILSNHSVGTLIKTRLHQTLGPYSNQFLLAADMDFFTKAYHAGARIEYIPEWVGYWGRNGISGSDMLRCILENMLVRLRYGTRLEMEIPLTFLRILRHYVLIRRQLRKYQQK